MKLVDSKWNWEVGSVYFQPDCCLPGNAPKVIIDFLRENQEKESFTSESWKMHSEVLKYLNSIFGDLNNTLARGFSIRIEISLSTEGERGYSLVMGNYRKRQQEIKVLNCGHRGSNDDGYQHAN